MTTLNDIRKELRCSNISEVKRAARRLGHDIVDPKKNLPASTIAAVREEVLAERQRKRSRIAETNSKPIRQSKEDQQSAPLIEDARPRASGPVRGRGNQVFLHKDVEDWMLGAPPRLHARANLLIRQFIAHGRPSSRVRPVQGPGKGWLRSALGGNRGKQFYLWWTQKGAGPAADLQLKDNEIFVRIARHHDDTHLALDSCTRSNYTRVDPSGIAHDGELFGHPFNDNQEEVALSPARVRFIKGHPGSGKTTALWHATCAAEGDRVLYLTFSDLLGRQAEEYFAAFGPRSQEILVSTLEQLLADLVPSGDQTRETFDPEIAARRFRKVVADDFRGGLGEWQDKEADLYAELHANWAGRSLPIDFRNVRATKQPALDGPAYVGFRSKALGHAASEVAERVGGFLLESGQAPTLMPGPFRARVAVDGLRNGAPVPTALHGLDWIVVDEVQDLTLVECLLILELARSLGRLNSGRPPGIMAAGDEGQTVRPTDFEWGQLADLFSQLGVPSDFELPGNVRCPPNLAEVVNRTWDLYGKLRRGGRPRGHARADIEDGDPGRIIIVEAESDAGLKPLFDLIDRTPGAALVYPGYSIPARYEDLIEDPNAGLLWTSRAAKGLDFQVVGLLDAGLGMANASELAKAGRGVSDISAIWSRNLIDQVRVGISRSTDTLLLVDVAPDNRSKAAIEALCSGVEEVQHADPEEAEALLSVEGLDVGEVINRFLDDIGRLAADHPRRALRRARVAQKVLDHSETATAAVGELRRSLSHAHAHVAVAAALRTDQGGKETEAGQLLDEASRMLSIAGEREARRAIDLARNVIETPPARWHQAAKSVGALAKLQRELPRSEGELRRELLGLIQRWCRYVTLSGPIPTTPAARLALSKELAGLVGHLGDGHEVLSAEVRERLREYRMRSGDMLKDQGEYREALTWYQGLGVPLREAYCLEKQGDFGDASRLYETGEDLEAALKCSRCIPDWERSLELARRDTTSDHQGRIASLGWSKRLLQLLKEVPEGADRLTAAERRDLHARFSHHSLLKVGVEEGGQAPVPASARGMQRRKRKK